MPRAAGRKDEFLQDKDIRAWYNSIKEGSELTANVYLRRLANFTGGSVPKAKEVTKMDSKKAYRFLLDVVTSYHEGKNPDSGRPYAGGYIESVVKSLKSWLNFNDVLVLKKIKIQGARETPTLADEVPPTPQDLKRILGVTDPRVRAAGALIAFTGCRLEVLGNHNDKDGLKVSDFPEMEVKDGSVSFKQIPIRVKVRKTVSKAGHDYFTFLPKEGCEYLEVYLKSRIMQGEKLGPSTPVITASVGQVKRIPSLIGKHVTTTNISDLLRKAIRNAGFATRPYVLKRYCTVRMQMAEADGMVPHVWVLFWTGWKGEIANTYTTNKGLPPDAIEQMRKAYEKASDKYLVTIREKSLTEDRLAEEFNRRFLLISEFTEDEIKAMGDISKLTPQQLHDLSRQKRMEELGLRNGNHQKVVKMEEVKGMILEGWEFVQQLPTQEAIIRLPAVR